MTLVDLFQTFSETFALSDFLLPFLLVFVISFAILDKAKIISSRKKINVIIAVILGLVFVIPHITNNYSAIGFDPVDVINQSLPQVGVILVAFVMLFILLGVVVTKEGKPGQWLINIVNIVSIVAIILIFLQAVGLLNVSWISWLFESDEVLAFVVMILVFGLVIGYITKEEKPKGGKAGEKIKEFLGELGMKEQ